MSSFRVGRVGPGVQKLAIRGKKLSDMSDMHGQWGECVFRVEDGQVPDRRHHQIRMNGHPIRKMLMSFENGEI